MRSFILALPILISVSSARSLYSELSISVRQTSDNLQTFTGNLGVSAPPITNSGDAKRPFDVAGDTFVNFAAAAQRTCDKQFNGCADQANSGAAFSVNDCQTQKDACDAAQQSATVTSFSGGASAGTASGTASATAAAPVATGTTSCTTARRVRRTRVRA